jgi:hypothetical protein
MAKDGLSEVYGDLKSLGLFVVSLSVLVSIIVSIVFILYSVLLYFQQDNHTKTVKGVVMVSDCQKLSNSLYRCNLTVVYSVDGKEYSTKQLLDNQKNVVNVYDGIDVNYDPDEPGDSIVGLTPGQLSAKLLLSGVTILVASLVVLWLTYNFKVLQAGQGAVVLASLF